VDTGVKVTTKTNAAGVYSFPELNNWAMALAKYAHISERMYFDFRFEFFNVFNHAQFEGPGGLINGSNFGLVRPRTIRASGRSPQSSILDHCKIARSLAEQSGVGSHAHVQSLVQQEFRNHGQGPITERNPPSGFRVKRTPGRYNHGRAGRTQPEWTA
jgi:hypothetical protein